MTSRNLLKRRVIFCEFKKCFRYDESEKKNLCNRNNWCFLQIFCVFNLFLSVRRIYLAKILYLCTLNTHYYFMDSKHLNRIKVALAEKEKTNKWLAEQLGKDQATISKWVTNTTQPNLEMLLQIAKVLEVNVNELVRPL